MTINFNRLVGVALGAALVLGTSFAAANDAKKPSPAEIESRLSPAQRKYLEMLRFLVGVSRTPKTLARVCDERFPDNRDRHRQALAEWDARNKTTVDELEKRRATALSAQARGNLVQIADAERAFNANVAKTAMNLFAETSSDENRERCANLSSILASEYYDLEPHGDESMHAATIRLIRAVSPALIEAWYTQ